MNGIDGEVKIPVKPCKKYASAVHEKAEQDSKEEILKIVSFKTTLAPGKECLKYGFLKFGA